MSEPILAVILRSTECSDLWQGAVVWWIFDWNKVIGIKNIDPNERF
jgi:hypothetical protein